jgi:hypothetical protein
MRNANIFLANRKKNVLEFPTDVSGTKYSLLIFLQLFHAILKFATKELKRIFTPRIRIVNIKPILPLTSN